MAKVKKIKASTLIETLIAMVIIMATFGISMMISLNIEKFNNSRIKLKAYLLIENEMAKSKNSRRYVDDELDFENITLKKYITPYRNNKKVKVITIEAFNRHQRKLIESREVVIDEQIDN